MWLVAMAISNKLLVSSQAMDKQFILTLLEDETNVIGSKGMRIRTPVFGTSSLAV